jgi:2-dehydro-3-deoxyphosphogluconate aldolase / (4S)-4-hydroxy-2-oxoglutarate aldolase
MDKNEILNKIKELGLLAVIRGPSPDLTIKMVAALVAGGVTGIEITFSTPNAPQVVETLAHSLRSSMPIWQHTPVPASWSARTAKKIWRRPCLPPVYR